MAVFRIYTEKKEEFAAEAKMVAAEISSFLEIEGLKSLRVINRYDVEGIDRELFDKCRYMVFSEPRVDHAYDELPEGQHILAVESLPGQYDQRADSCAQCIQLMSLSQRPKVRTARIYLLSGNLSPRDLAAIRNYLINPVENREAQSEPFLTLEESFDIPADVAILDGFRSKKDEELISCLLQYGLAMDRADLLFCRDYFREEGRDPTLTEILMIDTYWSDHCRHTTFLTHIDNLNIKDSRAEKAYRSYLDIRNILGRGDKPITLMDVATIGAKYLKHTGALTSLDESEEVNACSVKIDVNVDGRTEPWLLMFKNETHNHPTEIEPFGGAATCVGGAIRDPLSGRAYVYQAMRITGAANPFTPVDQTIPGKLPQRKLTTTAAAGYSSYGNQVGVAAGLIKEIYHPGYAAKRMEMGAVIAAAPASHVIREAPKPGDGVILLGARTGRDGCGGAASSSKSHTLDSAKEFGSEVQKGNAPEERKIQRLFRKAKVTQLIKRCNDFGAGGVSVAVGELADSLEIDLDAVPVKYGGLDGTVLAISESQERMAVVVASENIDLFIQYAKEENLEATLIAKVTDTGRLIMNWRGKKIVDISRKFLNSNGTPKHANVEIPMTEDTDLSRPSTFDGKNGPIYAELRNALEKLVDDLNYCSQKGLSDLFDSSIGAGTVLMPYGGAYMETPAQAMASKLPVLNGDTDTCSVMSFGFDPFLTEKDPYMGSYLAVIESVAKLTACGGDLSKCWLSFQEYFEKLGDEPLRWGKPFAALLGALSAQTDLGIAAIGGKDSMSGSFEDLSVPPTLVSVAVSLCNGEDVISPEFKKIGNSVLLIEPEHAENNLPSKSGLLSCFRSVQQLIKDKRILSAYAVTSAGPAEGIFKMSLGNRIGLRFSPDFDLSLLFKPGIGSFLVEWDNSAYPASESVTAIPVGITTEDFSLVLEDGTIDLGELRTLYNSKLKPLFPTAVSLSPIAEAPVSCPLAPGPDLNINRNSIKSSFDPAIRPYSKLAKPKALILVFPGTGGEYDAAKAFERAGGNPEIEVIRNLAASDAANSYTRISQKIRESQIIVLPGGASLGDEPDGAGKFIALFLRNPAIEEELRLLLENRDGLMLGISNGFQALIKSGLLPYGRITDPPPHSPALAVNPLGKHQSLMIHTRITANSSPWFSGTRVGEVYTMPISHKEGRFTADDILLKQLFENGQIAAQYADLSGNPTMDMRFNPAGSAMAVEALTSPDGRILGKMGHFERSGSLLYKNIPGNKELRLFENAVRYYRI